jgi:hypothetical protein
MRQVSYVLRASILANVSSSTYLTIELASSKLVYIVLGRRI